MISSNCFAMTFSQPVEIGEIGIGVQSPYGGIYIKGASFNNGKYYTKWREDGKNYDNGMACFGNDTDSLYFHYNYDLIPWANKKTNYVESSRFGDKDKSNTVYVPIGAYGNILKIKTNERITFYSIRFEYCVTHLTIIGKRKDGKWIKYIDSKNISKNYFGGKDSYKEDGGIMYKQPICQNDEIIVQYYRWHWKGTSVPEGEFRFKWNDSAQWFGIEQVVY